jgi:hypothetical protein
MVEEQIIQWIKDSLNKGYSKEQVELSLIQNNFTKEQILEAFEQITPKEKKQIKRNPVIETFAIVILIAMIVGGMIFFSKGNEIYLQEEVQIQSIQLKNCFDFAQNIKSCSLYTCEFHHPISMEILTREIKGIENDKCIYVEKMPNNLEFKCNFSLSEMNSISNYFETKNILFTQVVINNEEIKYILNGEESLIPFQEAINNKNCIITQ